MQLQGQDDDTVERLRAGDLAGAAVDAADRALLELVELVTRHAYRTTSADIAKVRDAGWDDQQIGEAIYVTAIFAMFNRVADAFGLEDPAYRK